MEQLKRGSAETRDAWQRNLGTQVGYASRPVEWFEAKLIIDVNVQQCEGPLSCMIPRHSKMKDSQEVLETLVISVIKMPKRA